MRDCVIAADTDRSANSGSNATCFFLLMLLLGDAKMRHLFTEMVTETTDEKAAGQFAELFVQAMADDEFAAQVARIGEKYQPMMKEMLEQASRVSSEETAAATSLSEKYHVVFRPNYYDSD